MKRLLTLALLGILGVTGLSYSQEIPDGVKKIMDQLQNDPDAELGFNYAKARGYIDQNVQFENWHVGLPIEFFKVNGNQIEKATPNSKIDDLIEPTHTWYIPIKINDEGYLYHVMLYEENTQFKTIGCGESVLGWHAWDKVRKKYPEESGLRPIVIGLKHKFIYFPHKKNGKNIFYVKSPKWNDELSKMTSNSLDDLDEDVKIMDYWKNEWKKNKEKRRKFYEKHPDIFKNKSGGKK